MKKVYNLLLCLIGLNIVVFDVNAQTQIHADAVIENSSDFLQTNALVDLDPSNYCYLSASVGVLSSSFITFSFPQAGQSGDILSIDVQGTGGLLNVSLLDNITILLYDESNVNVATATGGALLGLDLSLTASSVYTLRYMTDVTASYKIKKVKLVLNNLLSVQVLNEFRIYSAMLQTPCAPVFATSVASYSNNLLTGFVSTPANSISTSTTDFATMKVLVAIPPLTNTASLALNFATKGIAGEYVGFTVSKASTILTLEVLQSLKMEVFNSSGVLKATKSNFALVDLKLLAGSTDKYYIGFVTPPGSYDIARLKLTMGGISLLNTLNVFNAMHFKLQPAVVNLQSSSTGFCSGSSVTLTASAPGSAILWSNGATTNSITVNTAGTYNFVATDNQGCSSTSSAIVMTVLPLPTLSIGNGATSSFCSNANVVLTSIPSLGATVLWSNGATTNNITVNTAGTYKVTATGINGCKSAIASVVVSELPKPTVSIANGATAGFCFNSNVSLTSTSSAGSTLLWSNGAITNNITVNTGGVYTLVATGANGCLSDVASVTVNALPIPTVTIGNGSTANFCSNKSILLTSTPSAGATVLWSNSATTNDISVNIAGTYTVTAKDVNGCLSAAATVVVNAFPIPTVTIGNGTTVDFCSNKNILLTSTASAGAAILWSNGATTNDITVNTAGTYTVTATALNGCHSDIASITVNALIAPTVSINNGSTFDLCSNKNIVLMSAPSSGATVLWSNGATTNDITVNSAGTYSVVATHTNGCKSGSASITINSLVAPVVTIANGSTTSFCANATLTLTSTASSGTTVLWSTGAVTNDIVVNAAGTYTVTVTAANGCDESAKIIVSTIGIPAINQTVKNVTCNGAGDGSIEISPIDRSADYNYTWSTSATISSINHLSPGTYSIDISDVNTSCTRHEEYTITEPLVLTLQGVAFNETCLGNDGKIELTVNGGTAPYHYNQPSIVDNVFSRLTVASYTITVTDKNNCSATETFPIHAANCNMVLNIHNVITPNNDGLNEVMMIEGIENFPNSNLDILNKWGDVVYSSRYYDNSWSGRNNEDTANLPAGTYYYILKLTTPKVPNGERDYTGFVMIQ